MPRFSAGQQAFDGKLPVSLRALGLGQRHDVVRGIAQREQTLPLASLMGSSNWRDQNMGCGGDDAAGFVSEDIGLEAQSAARAPCQSGIMTGFLLCKNSPRCRHMG